MRSRSCAVGFIPFLAGLALVLGSAGALRAAEECLECHGTVDNVGEDRLVVDATKWEATVHGAAGASCADCHPGKTKDPHEADDPRAATRRLERLRGLVRLHQGENTYLEFERVE